MRKRVLFVCEGNLHRSPTAAWLYGQTPGIAAKSAGLSHLARTQITDELVKWADVIIVMESRLQRLVQRQFLDAIQTKEIVCLNIPDDFQFQQKELISLLRKKLTPLLGEPQRVPSDHT